MPNPVAVNDLQPISGSLQTSRVSYGVETADKNYGQNYNGTTWYSNIPNNGEFYTIISDNYTANYYISRSNAGGAYVEGGLPAVDEYSAPVFWTTVGTSSLDVITTVNGLPDRVGQLPFNSGAEALNWVASSSNYFAVGPDYYNQMDADQLRLFYHANQVISYPTTQSTWYDISGYTNPNGTLTNGPVWNSNGWIEFDGTDDTVSTTPWALNNEFSYEGTFYINPSDSSYSGFFGNVYSPSGYASIGSGWVVRLDPSGNLEVYLKNNQTGATRTILINSFRSTYLGKWFNLAFVSSGSTNTLYVNNTAYNGSAYTVGLINPSAELIIGGYDWGAGVDNYYLKGANEYTRAYSKALTTSDVAQNYYGGPIVTDQLIFAVDAGNLVSYPKSGTTTYSLTSLTGNVNGTLTNGVGFSPADGGTWTFDGVDDYIDIGTLNYSNNITLEVWVNTSNPIGWDDIIAGGCGDLLFGINSTGNGTVSWGGQCNVPFLSVTSTTSIADGSWHHVVATYNGSVAAIYIDGNLNISSGRSGIFTPGNITIGSSGGSSEFFNGKIASTRIYEKALTAAEVQQNYNATK
tara:strand:- start:282 stop:2009 length:1728 start_codon:yes stop_codon:yes gene_type:complete